MIAFLCGTSSSPTVFKNENQTLHFPFSLVQTAFVKQIILLLLEIAFTQWARTIKSNRAEMNSYDVIYHKHCDCRLVCCVGSNIYVCHGIFM